MSAFGTKQTHLRASIYFCSNSAISFPYTGNLDLNATIGLQAGD